MVLLLLLLVVVLLLLLELDGVAGEDVAIIGMLLLFALLVSVDIAAAIFRHGGP